MFLLNIIYLSLFLCGILSQDHLHDVEVSRVQQILNLPFTHIEGLRQIGHGKVAVGVIPHVVSNLRVEIRQLPGAILAYRFFMLFTDNRLVAHTAFFYHQRHGNPPLAASSSPDDAPSHPSAIASNRGGGRL